VLALFSDAPSTLVLDEAFAGVDVQGAADFYKLLDELETPEVGQCYTMILTW